MAQPFLQAPLDKQGQWWVGGSHLYEVFARPIYFGPSSEDHVLGFLAVGYEINDVTASEISRVAGGHVAFYFGNQIVKSTLTPEEGEATGDTASAQSISHSSDSIQLGNERFLAASVDLAPEGANSGSSDCAQVLRSGYICADQFESALVDSWPDCNDYRKLYGFFHF